MPDLMITNRMHQKRHIAFGLWLQRIPLLVLLVLQFSVALPLPAVAEEPQPGPEKPEYNMGVFPFLSPTATESVFAPIAAELAKALDRPVHLHSSSTFEIFTERLRRQQYDIVHIHPFDYVKIAVKAGYLPLASRIEDLSAQIVVLHDSPLRSAKDLTGKTIGMAPKTSSLSYLTRIALKQAGFHEGTTVYLKYFSSHLSCLQQLHIGNISACATSDGAMRLFEAQANVKLRVLMQSPSIPHTLFVVHSRVPKADRDRIARTILSTSLSGVPTEMKELFVEKDGKYFRPVTDADYDIVRKYIDLLGKD